MGLSWIFGEGFGGGCGMVEMAAERTDRCGPKQEHCHSIKVLPHDCHVQEREVGTGPSPTLSNKYLEK